MQASAFDQYIFEDNTKYRDLVLSNCMLKVMFVRISNKWDAAAAFLQKQL